MRALRFLLRKEFLQLSRDPLILVMLFVMPIVQLLLMANAATFEVRNSRLYVVDMDHSTMSRALVDRLVASGRFRPSGVSQSMVAADDALQRREVDAIVAIPHDFERNIVADRPTSVQLVLNAEDGAAAGVTQSYARQVVDAYAREVGSRDGRGKVSVAAGAAGPRPPGPRMELARRGWYNPELEYRDYMIPGVLVALVTIVGTLLTALNIVREKEAGTLDQLNVTPISRASFIAAKLIPLWLLSLVVLTIGLGIAHLAFDLPVRGSLALVFLAAGLYLLGALGIGLWISTVAETQQQALFVSYSIMLVYLLMSGLFTPVRSMPGWAQLMAQLSPVMHFTALMRAVLLKGAVVADVGRELIFLASIGVAVLALGVRQYRKRAT